MLNLLRAAPIMDEASINVWDTFVRTLSPESVEKIVHHILIATLPLLGYNESKEFFANLFRVSPNK